MNSLKHGPNRVEVVRERKGPGDIGPIEKFIGYLVDEYGNDVETPEVGSPIYLAGEDKKGGVHLFETDPAFRVDVYETHWVVTTELGTCYTISNERIIQ